MEMEKHGMLDSVRRVAGTSAGAIAALMISLGYSGEELADIISETKLQKFNDGRFFFIGGFSRLNRYYGWYRGEAFNRWLGELIGTKTGNPDITFREIHDSGRFKDLYVTGTDLLNQKLVVFSWENHPTMKVRDAVRISMSIPLYFQAICLDEKGHVINCRKEKDISGLFVDGGIAGNFPITVFDSLTSDKTLGFRIDTPEQIKFDQQGKGLAPAPIHTFRNYIGSFYCYVIENLNRQKLSAEDWERTISISSGKIGPKIKRLTKEEKEILLSNGRAAVSACLSGNP
jgi:NTE family protein